MKIIDFSEISQYDFAISDISVIYQTPTWQSLIMSKAHSGRILNGFLLIDKGGCRYEWAEGEAELSSGSLIYLPKGSVHRVSVTEHEFSFYRVSFVLKDISDGEEIVFGTGPAVVTYAARQAMFDICGELIKTTMSKSNIFKSTSLLCDFLTAVGKTIKDENSNPEYGRIFAAIDHIEKHYAEEVDIKALADMCYLSEPHFFRLFKREIGDTPISYRNRLRVEKAKMLLSDGECSVSEISAMLGFESVYYFSRVFKKSVGVSPTVYQQNAL